MSDSTATLKAHQSFQTPPPIIDDDRDATVSVDPLADTFETCNTCNTDFPLAVPLRLQFDR